MGLPHETTPRPPHPLLGMATLQRQQCQRHQQQTHYQPSQESTLCDVHLQLPFEEVMQDFQDKNTALTTVCEDSAKSRYRADVNKVPTTAWLNFCKLVCGHDWAGPERRPATQSVGLLVVPLPTRLPQYPA